MNWRTLAAVGDLKKKGTHLFERAGSPENNHALLQMDNRRECSLADIATHLGIGIREPLGCSARKASDEGSGDECLDTKAAQAGGCKPEWIARQDEINNVPTSVTAQRALTRRTAYAGS